MPTLAHRHGRAFRIPARAVQGKGQVLQVLAALGLAMVVGHGSAVARHPSAAAWPPSLCASRVRARPREPDSMPWLLVDEAPDVDATQHSVMFVTHANTQRLRARRRELNSELRRRLLPQRTGGGRAHVRVTMEDTMLAPSEVAHLVVDDGHVGSVVQHVQRHRDGWPQHYPAHHARVSRHAHVVVVSGTLRFLGGLLGGATFAAWAPAAPNGQGSGGGKGARADTSLLLRAQRYCLPADVSSAVIHVLGVLELPADIGASADRGRPGQGPVTPAFGPDPGPSPAHIITVHDDPQDPTKDLAMNPATLYAVTNISAADVVDPPAAATGAFFRPSSSDPATDAFFWALHENFDLPGFRWFEKTYLPGWNASFHVSNDDTNNASACRSAVRAEYMTCAEPSLDAQYISAGARGAAVAMESEAWLDQHGRPGPGAAAKAAAPIMPVAPATVGRSWSGSRMIDYTLFRATLHDAPLPPVLSFSYIANSHAFVGAVGFNATGKIFEAVTEQHEVLALAGVTVVVSSGDDGSVGQRLHCADNFSVNLLNSEHAVVVGATQYMHTPDLDAAGRPPSSREEVAQACGQSGSFITSGGGFVPFLDATPPYQQSAVSAYLANQSLLPSDKGQYYHGRGRGFPDVSLVGHRYKVVINDDPVILTMDGTSASAPFFAGLALLLKHARLAAGKTNPAFLTPILYQLAASSPGSFYDILSGSNECGRYAGSRTNTTGDEQGCSCCSKDTGFKAGVGWDAVTGLGSVNYGRLRDAYVGLPETSGDDALA